MKNLLIFSIFIIVHGESNSLANVSSILSVSRCPACAPCDIEKRSEAFQWSPIPNMGPCMGGYDYFTSNRFSEQGDPGLRKQIFEPTVWSEEHRAMLPSNNIHYSTDINCNIQQQTSVVKTMKEYMQSASGSTSFSTYSSSQMDIGIPFFSLFTKAGYEETETRTSSGSSAFSATKSFFGQMQGEMYINKASCNYYKITINPYSKPTFTDGFINGLRKLQRAYNRAPFSRAGYAALKEFTMTYGNSYLSTCHMGASITTISQAFSRSRSASMEAARKKCVSESYSEGTNMGIRSQEMDISGKLTAGAEGLGAEVGMGYTTPSFGGGSGDGFSRSSSKCFGEGKSESASAFASQSKSKIISIGALPYANKDDWLNAVKENPAPSKFELTPIYSLLTHENLKDIPLDPENPDSERLNGPNLKEYLIFGLYKRYCEVMLGRACEGMQGCSWFNDCKPEEECVEDDSEKGFRCVPGELNLILHSKIFLI